MVALGEIKLAAWQQAARFSFRGASMCGSGSMRGSVMALRPRYSRSRGATSPAAGPCLGPGPSSVRRLSAEHGRRFGGDGGKCVFRTRRMRAPGLKSLLC